MQSPNSPSAVGLLLSGGLDSGILLGHLLRQGYFVHPLYIRAGLHWERDELRFLQPYLSAMQGNRLARLVTLEMPLDDVYGQHWSITGRDMPDAETADDAVYLPGRNLILIGKAAVWCSLHGISQLALAVLGTNPFGDASREFFEHFEKVLACALGSPIEIVRPFGELRKRDVMEIGRDLPLELTFSCIAPHNGMHCGRCNKCAERQEAFRAIGMEDPTKYASFSGDLHSHAELRQRG